MDSVQLSQADSKGADIDMEGQDGLQDSMPDNLTDVGKTQFWYDMLNG